MTIQAMTLSDILLSLDGVADSTVLAGASRSAAREAANVLRQFSRTLLGDPALPASALSGKLNTYVEDLFEADDIRASHAAALAQRDQLLAIASSVIPSDWAGQTTNAFRVGYDTLLAGKPAYWSPHYFKGGEKVMYGEIQAFIEGFYSEGMWNIRTQGGSACVSGASLKRA